jgi:hypothetical protein
MNCLVNRLWVPIIVWGCQKVSRWIHLGNQKTQDYSGPKFVGLCRKQVEGEKFKGARFQAFRAARSQ